MENNTQCSNVCPFQNGSGNRVINGAKFIQKTNDRLDELEHDMLAVNKIIDRIDEMERKHNRWGGALAVIVAIPGITWTVIKILEHINGG